MTALLLPTDACPRCLTAVPVHPARVDEFPAINGIAAVYSCPACKHQWWTGWADSARDLPCPGCPACRGEKEHVA